MSEQPQQDPVVLYRRPTEGIKGPEDYPNAPISIVCDRSTPGAGLFGVMVAIGGDIPLHYHSMMEFQFVLSGTGLALDADGGEVPIAPGGTVLSPAGPAGAHGFRNTGPLPLTLLCVYPSPGGATPDRSPFDVAIDPGAGPRSVYVAPGDVRAVPSSHRGEGLLTGRIIDDRVAGAELFAELLAVPAELASQRHAAHELLYVVTGTGIASTGDGRDLVLEPGGILSCPPGERGAHALRNTGSMPLQLLSVLPSAGGAFPG
ncbi:MAG: cupin domain-containing protein [Candidatus Limnocylindrales bacterium]